MIERIIRPIVLNRIIAPEICSIEGDKIDMLVGLLDNIAASRKGVVVDFTLAKTITFEAYMVILAELEKLNRMDVRFKLGDEHRHYIFLCLYKGVVGDVVHPMKVGASGKFERAEVVDPMIIEAALDKGLRAIGITKFYALNSLMVELVSNAKEHGIESRQMNWWMLVRRYPDREHIRIVLLDRGGGIVESYRNSAVSVDGMDNYEIVEGALSGVLGSSTGQEWRGTGLPQLKTMLEKSWIAEMTLITNDITLRYTNKELRRMPVHREFGGTYFELLVTRQNYLRWKRKL